MRTAFKLLPGLALATLLFTAVPAAAAVIYDNGGPDFNNSDFSEEDSPEVFIADNLMLSQGASLTDIHWWGGYDVSTSTDIPGTHSFTLRITPDDGGVPLDGWDLLNDSDPSPGIVVDLGKITTTGDTGYMAADPSNDPTPDPLGGFDFVYWYNLSTPIDLAANKTYWLWIINAADGKDWFWAKADSSNPSSPAAKSNDGIGWNDVGFDVAFNLTGTFVSNQPNPVPEPGILGLFGLGLLLLRRRLS